MPARNFTDAQESEIAQRYLAGESCKSIAKSLGMKHHISICAALRRQGVKQRSAPERNRLYQLNPHVFDVIDNEHAAYWLGFLYADGNIYRHTLNLAIQIRDRNHIESFRQFMESESPIKEQVYPGCHNAIISLTDRHLTSKLGELGIVTDRPFPERFLPHVPHKLVHHAIRGFFDGDGCAHKYGSISFCGSQLTLSWIRAFMAEKVGTNPDLTLVKHTKSDIYYLSFSGRIQALKVATMMYSDATVFLPRKREVVLSWNQSPVRLHASGWKWHKTTPTPI